MPDFKPPPGVAISLRKAPGREPVPERLRETMEWIRMRQRPTMFQSHYDPYGRPDEELCSSAIPDVAYRR